MTPGALCDCRPVPRKQPPHHSHDLLTIEQDAQEQWYQSRAYWRITKSLGGGLCAEDWLNVKHLMLRMERRGFLWYFGWYCLRLGSAIWQNEPPRARCGRIVTQNRALQPPKAGILRHCLFTKEAAESLDSDHKGITTFCTALETVDREHN